MYTHVLDWARPCDMLRRARVCPLQVSCVDACASRGLVGSGSWDATVKLWGFKRARSASVTTLRAGSSRNSSGATAASAALPFVGLNPTPLAEVFDHTSPVLCVALGPGAALVPQILWQGWTGQGIPKLRQIGIQQ